MNSDQQQTTCAVYMLLQVAVLGPLLLQLMSLQKVSLINNVYDIVMLFV